MSNVVKRIKNKLKTGHTFIRMAPGSFMGGKQYRNTNVMILLMTRTMRKRSEAPITEPLWVVNRHFQSYFKPMPFAATGSTS